MRAPTSSDFRRLKLPQREHRILTAEDFAGTHACTYGRVHTRMHICTHAHIHTRMHAVEMLSREQLLRMRDDVERELAAVVGWTSTGQAADSHAPTEMLRRVQTTMLQMERDGAGAGAAGMSWNMWVTGGSGTGKTKFAHFLARYLRAYGAIDKDLVAE